jgi:SNW domain-containing protein 1
MSTLYDSLPKPSKICPDPGRAKETISSSVSKLNLNNNIPAYGKRKGWTPRHADDFGSGGAFPEIHVVQYPLEMGKKITSGQKSHVLPVQLDSEGKIKYDVIVKQGSNKNKIVYNKLQDLLPSEILNEDDPSLQKPDEEEVISTTDATRLALEKLTQSKISAALPVRRAESTAPAKYIRYTPSNQMAITDGSEGQSSAGPGQRIIRMIEVQKDPLEPPKFRINKKIPGAPPSPPPPVMHSPPRKITVKEQQEWKIPPTISNWKNAKGYTIPLDKRLAADGRGLQQTHINPKFAEFTEALYIADRKAREEVELRAQMEKKVAQKEKEKKEENLRNLAKKAREERAGIRPVDPDADDDEDDEVRDRDEIRRERHKERQRDKNIARAAPDKRTRLERERERDISEQVALGVANPRVNLNEVQFDQRLFNQSRGLGTGFGDDDDYNVYDKGWRGDNELAKNLYRPSRSGKDADLYGDDLETLKATNRFVPDKEFSGIDRSAGTSRSGGPVQFERHRDEEDDDPFGLGKFLNEAKTASKRNDSDRSDRHHETNRASYKKSRHD